MAANQILVFSEKDSLRRELLGKACQEAEKLGWQVAAAVLEGDPAAASLGNSGADVVYPLPASAAESSERMANLLAEVAAKVQPAVVALGATKLGMEVAAVLVERLGASYAPWTVRYEIDPSGALTASCMLYAGSGLAAYAFTPGPVVLTGNPGAFAKVEGAGKAGRVEALQLEDRPARVQVLGSRAKVSGAASLEDAKMVLDVGQGFKQRDDLALATAVTELLDGQLACSRPVSSDRDWFPDWLGLSGKKVKPELCLTVGLSGAVQHIVGIRDSHRIAAVNSDEGAPIFNQADYGVVADLYEFLPALAERIRARGVRPAWKA
ncbi:MAG TPA: electron transfer flavoprotein subunit alpha/FixB family protein [Anaerolineaceae bacterium]